MMLIKNWKPKPIWKSKTVYVIGGGQSLEHFNFKLLRHKHTVGCNSAFLLGHRVVDIVAFGDHEFLQKNWMELRRYKGVIVTNNPRLKENPPYPLYVMKRVNEGLGKPGDGVLGWNGNTGSVAINLALLLGAVRVYLLGFDMKPGDDGKPNWHNNQMSEVPGEVFQRHLEGFEKVAIDAIDYFPEAEIINLTEDSRLDVFPKQSLLEHFDNLLNKGIK